MFDLPRTALVNWLVLLVDDEPDSLEIVATLFASYGASVLQATNGEEGLRMAQATPPDFIVCDLSMPKMDGWDMLKLLKANPALAHIPMIALSAHALPSDRQMAAQAGFHGYMSKPLVPETFVAEVVQLLRAVPSLAQRLAPPPS